MKKSTARACLVVILLAAFFLRQYRLLDFPYHGDEVDEGDIALEILDGNLAPFYPQNEGNEALYQFVLAPFFAILGDSVIANRWPSAAWSMVLVALMYTYGRVLFRSRRVGVMAAGLTAALWWPTVFGRLGLREISQPVMMTPALLGLMIVLRSSSGRDALKAGVIGGTFAGLTSYTFLSGRGFPVIVLLFLGHLALVERDRLRRQWRAVLAYCILMVAVSVPLFAYLAAHPELDYHVQDLGARSWLAQGDIGGLVKNIQDTLGMFTIRGDMNWVRNIAGRPVFVGPEGWLFYLGVVLCLSRWRKPEYVLQLIVIATMLAPNILTEDPPRWTRSIGILPGLLATTVLPIEWAWARVEEWSKTARVWPKASYAALVVVLGISIYARTSLDMFQNWIDNPNVYWMTLAFYDGAAQYINHSPDSTPVNYVMDFYNPWRKHNIERPVERQDVALRWSVKNAFVLPDDSRGWRVAFQIFGDPARPLQETFLDLEHPIFVDARADPTGQRPLRFYSIPRTALDDHLARAGQGAIFSPETNIPIAPPLQVGDLFTFLGYEILNPNARPGDELDVLTYWRVLRRPPEIAIFLHLIDAEGKIAAQYDGLDVVFDDLAPGDTVVQLHALKLPYVPSGLPYRFEMGAYTRDNLERIPLNISTDRVWLQSWQPK